MGGEIFLKESAGGRLREQIGPGAAVVTLGSRPHGRAVVDTTGETAALPPSLGLSPFISPPPFTAGGYYAATLPCLLKPLSEQQSVFRPADHLVGS